MQELVSICWLIPCPTNQTPVHTSSKFEGQLEGNETWVFACGRTTKPAVFSPLAEAATCENCCAKVKELRVQSGWDFSPPSPEIPEPELVPVNH